MTAPHLAATTLATNVFGLAVLGCALALPTTSLIAQGDGTRPLSSKPQLSKADHGKLNDALRKWLAAEMASLNNEDRRRRSKLRKAQTRARDSWDKEWKKRAKKEPLKSVADLEIIFKNVLPYEKQKAPPGVRTRKLADGTECSLKLPRKYDYEDAYRTVVVIPDRVEDKWVSAKDDYKAKWAEQGSFADETLFLLPHPVEEIEFDPAPRRDNESDMQTEMGRIAKILSTAGEVQRLFRFDRDRLILDCGKGSSGFGVRMAAYFPERFAALILRDPQPVPEDFRLGNLTGVNILMVANGGTKAAAEALKKRIDAQKGGACRIIEEGAGTADEITKWVSSVRRNLLRQEIILEPVHDRFRRNAWAEITLCEPILSLAKDQRPRLVVKADRAANRIEVTAKNVTSFSLLLNDELVDLDKEFSVVVNGKALNEKRTRSFYELRELVLRRFDESYLFPATYETTVPKDEAGGKSGDAPK